MQAGARIHLVPIGGIAMVPLAALLTEAGYRVTGSDGPLYPPMSTLLESLQIEVSKGFAPEHVPRDCELVVVGNAALRDNVEAAEAFRRGLPVLSMPQAIRELLLPGKDSVVIAGTHGKTTTSALVAWMLLDSGRDPSFLVGGEMKNLGRGYRRGAGPTFVLEGDEYNAAFFDRGPKFLHYRPSHLWLGNIEFDHADLFANVSAVEEAFRRVAAIVPAGGVVAYNADDSRAAAAAAHTPARQLRVSLADAGADVSARQIRYHPGGTELTLLEQGTETGRLASPLHGEHNLRNLLGAVALVRELGLPVSEIAQSLPRFEGVRRRMDVRGEPRGILVVDDFAHHPTAVAGTLSAARARWPGRRLWALFEPRSNTAGRRIFQEEYARAFAGADALVLAPIFHAKRLAPEEQLDRQALTRDFASSGRPALAAASIEEIVFYLRREARPGDVLILMSSGAFGGLPETITSALASEEGAPHR